jgi:hypothetical protein
MNTYKITNITNNLHKRDVHFKTPVKIQYVDDRMKKTAEVKTGESLFLTVGTLPLSIHRLRVKGLVDVSDASAAEVKKMNSSKTVTSKPKTKQQQKSESQETMSQSKKTYTRKSSTSKKKTYTRKSSSSKSDSTEKESTI